MSDGGMAETTAGHNSAARAGVIRDIKTKLADVDSRIRELQEERKRIKGRIKSDLGWKVADWNVMARFADLEDEPRDVLFDTLREGFRALGIGMQSTFLDALEGKPEAPKSGKLTEEEAEALGGAAARAGREQDDFDQGVRSKKLKEAWLKGYALAAAQRPASPAEAEAAAAERMADAEEFGDTDFAEDDAESS